MTSAKQIKFPKNQILKVIVLGGLEEVGRNMTLLEYNQDIIIIDMGLQFPEEDMFGIDYVIPNISYLKNKINKIRGVIITHAHYDHIGAIPHLIPELGNPVIFGTKLTLGIIQKRQEDFKNSPKLKLKTIDTKTKIKLGCFTLEFFKVSHNIPDSIGVIAHTPVGIIVHTGDFKLDFNPVASDPPEIAKIAELNRKNVLALMSDSTNADSPGHQLTETEIGQTLEQIFLKAKGRIIVGTFGSLLSRVQQVIWIAEKLNKKVVIEGYSMKSNVQIAHQLGYLKYKKHSIISLKEAKKLPDKQVVIMCTGAQGEDNSALVRIANEENPHIKISKGDTVIFSSSVIPGNERTVQRLKDTLYRKGAEVIHYQMMDVHAGGHARQEDLKLMLKLVNPKYLIPIEGNLSLLKAHERVAKEAGFPEKNIFVAENGQIIEFYPNQEGRLTNKKVPTDYVMVDGLGVGDVSHIVLRDRRMMAADGMVVLIATVERKTGKLVGNPDIISRGFVYIKESKKLIEETRKRTKKILQDKDPRSEANEAYLKNKMRNEIGQFLFQKTHRRPMILPVIIFV